MRDALLVYNFGLGRAERGRKGTPNWLLGVKYFPGTAAKAN
jgi:hypothetical protein